MQFYLRWHPSAILDFWGAFWDYPEVFIMGKIWWNPFSNSNSYSMKVWILCTFGWEMPMYALKIGIWGQFDTLNGDQYQCNPIKAHCCVKRRRMIVKIGLLVWPVHVSRPKTYRGKLGICPDHPCRWIKVQFGMVAILQAIVKFQV